MTNNNPKEYNLFTPQYSNEIFSDLHSREDDLFPASGEPEGELYPELRATKQDMQKFMAFLDTRNLSSLQKKRLMSYYRDIDLRKKKAKTKSNEYLF